MSGKHRSERHHNWLYRSADAALRIVLHRVPPSRLAERIALEWGYRFRPPPRVVRLRSGVRFNFENVDFIPVLLYYLGVFEPAMLRYLKAILRRGDTVLDVGANIGFHTLESWCAVGAEGLVISIEASPDHAEAVRRNLRANGYPDEQVVNVAVGEKDGEVSLGLPDGGNQGMFGINAGSERSFTVALHRIDDLIEARSVSDLALVKMDIEGSELAALQGAVATLRRYQPAVLIELNEAALARCGASADAVVRLLSDVGYEGWVVGRDGARRIEAGMRHECDECLFLPRDSVELRRRLNLPTTTPTR